MICCCPFLPVGRIATGGQITQSVCDPHLGFCAVGERNDFSGRHRITWIVESAQASHRQRGFRRGQQSGLRRGTRDAGALECGSGRRNLGVGTHQNRDVGIADRMALFAGFVADDVPRAYQATDAEREAVSDQIGILAGQYPVGKRGFGQNLGTLWLELNLFPSQCIGKGGRKDRIDETHQRRTRTPGRGQDLLGAAQGVQRTQN